MNETFRSPISYVLYKNICKILIIRNLTQIDVLKVLPIIEIGAGDTYV